MIFQSFPCVIVTRTLARLLGTSSGKKPTAANVRAMPLFWFNFAKPWQGARSDACQGLGNPLPCFGSALALPAMPARAQRCPRTRTHCFFFNWKFKKTRKHPTPNECPKTTNTHPLLSRLDTYLFLAALSSQQPTRMCGRVRWLARFAVCVSPVCWVLCAHSSKYE